MISSKSTIGNLLASSRQQNNASSNTMASITHKVVKTGGSGSATMTPRVRATETRRRKHQLIENMSGLKSAIKQTTSMQTQSQKSIATL